MVMPETMMSPVELDKESNSVKAPLFQAKKSSLVLENTDFSTMDTIGREQLLEYRSNLVIIDPRDFYEYYSLHIRGAINKPLNSLNPSLIRKLINIGRPHGIVFYCNSSSSSLAHRAASKAKLWGISNVYVYEEGIFDWALNNPDYTNCFNKPLSEYPEGYLLRKIQQSRSHFIPLNQFHEKVADSYMIIDIRMRHERKHQLVTFKNQKVLQFDQLARHIKQGNLNDTERLLIYDNDEHSCTLLHMHLNEAKFSNYFFLRGGVINNSSIRDYTVEAKP